MSVSPGDVTGLGSLHQGSEAGGGVESNKCLVSLRKMIPAWRKVKQDLARGTVGTVLRPLVFELPQSPQSLPKVPKK